MRKDGVHQMFSELPQFLAALLASISAISDGMQYGWSAPSLPRLREKDSPVKITKADEIWLESIYMISGLVCVPFTIYVVDTIGRQKSIILAATSGLLGWILIAMANRVEYLYVARFLAGSTANMVLVIVPMYVAEIADHKIRGFLASLAYLMLLVGILIIYSIGPYVPIYVSSIVGVVSMALQITTFPFMPESPYYLLTKGQTEKARKSLGWLRAHGNIEEELQDIKVAIERQISERGKLQDLILVNSNRKALIIMTVLNATQHFSSISVILMNLHSILTAAGSVYMNRNEAGILFAALLLISATVASFVMDRYGRKILLIASELATGMSLLTLATYFALKYDGYDVTGASWIPIAAVMVYAVAFKFGLGMIPIVMTAELFPANIRAMGMTMSDAMYILFSLLSIFVYSSLSQMYGLHVPFFIFAVSCLGSALFSLLYIPETKGKTLEEIQFILKGQHHVLPTKPMKNGIPVVSDNSIAINTRSESTPLEEDSINRRNGFRIGHGKMIISTIEKDKQNEKQNDFPN